jgi:hypothetical protein
MTHADGVHFVVVNHTDQDLVYNVDELSAYLSATDDGVGPGATVHALSVLSPGKSEVACDGAFVEGDNTHGPTVRIVDPGHFYHPIGELECDGRARAWMGPAGRPKRVPLLQLARHQIMGLVPTDQLSLGGYIHGGFRTVIVTRQRHIVMQVNYVWYPKQGWRYYLASGCAKEGFDIRPLRESGA